MEKHSSSLSQWFIYWGFGMGRLQPLQKWSVRVTSARMLVIDKICDLARPCRSWWTGSLISHWWHRAICSPMVVIIHLRRKCFPVCVKHWGINNLVWSDALAARLVISLTTFNRFLLAEASKSSPHTINIITLSSSLILRCSTSNILTLLIKHHSLISD